MPATSTTFPSFRLLGSRALWSVLIAALLVVTVMAQPAHAAWGTFWDDDGSTHEAYIEAMAEAGITEGCGGGKFCPRDSITREQMAAFLHRALEGKVATGSTTQFRDTSSSIFEDDIRWLSATGITKGCEDDMFCPKDPVTREQMAGFLRRALEDKLSVGSPIDFSDTSRSTFAADIAWLSATGVTKGCGNGKFCPKDPVTREQMASFLSRALGLDPIAPAPNFTNGVQVRTGDDLADMVRSRGSGTVFVLETGVHHMDEKVVPKDGMTFVGEPGAVMDGGNKTDAAFSNGGANVTIRNLIIQNYNTPAQRGAIEAAGDNWKIIDNEIRYNAGAGLSLGGDGFIVDGNNIHHNEQIGIIGQNASGAKVTGNEISYNNPNDRYDYGWESGGTKFLRTTNLYIANNNVHDNHGPGLWADHDNYNTTYEKNTVRDNYGPGILHEISYDANITNNTVTGNAHRFYVGGILIASSPNVEVKGNTLNSNDGGIIGLQDNRGSGNRGTYQTTGLNVHNNNVTWTNGFHGIQVNAGPDITKTNTINYDHNTYTTNQTNSFKWGTTSHNFQQWQTLGQDPNSTIN
jgi:parallel beta-helix repeat protein